MNCLKFAHRLIQNVYTWLVFVDLIFLWFVNKLARAITKWTRAFDKRSARLISHIHHTREFKQHCEVGNTAQQCLAEILKLKIDLGVNFVHVWKSHFCSHKLDVQEANFCLTQFEEI